MPHCILGKIRISRNPDFGHCIFGRLARPKDLDFTKWTLTYEFKKNVRDLQFVLAKSLEKTCLYVHEKLQRNPFVGSGLKIFIFRPYGFDYLGFLTNARRSAMRSKTKWVFYRDLYWWPGPQKVQFGEITGYPFVVGLFLALLKLACAASNRSDYFLCIPISFS